MTEHYISTFLGLESDSALPECYLGGIRHDAPIISWDTFAVSLDAVNNPATYLRDWAHQLLALAAEVDARQNTRQPSGYDAPIPYVLPTDAEDRAGAEMHS